MKGIKIDESKYLISHHADDTSIIHEVTQAFMDALLSVDMEEQV